MAVRWASWTPSFGRICRSERYENWFASPPPSFSSIDYLPQLPANRHVSPLQSPLALAAPVYRGSCQYRVLLPVYTEQFRYYQQQRERCRWCQCQLRYALDPTGPVPPTSVSCWPLSQTSEALLTFVGTGCDSEGSCITGGFTASPWPYE